MIDKACDKLRKFVNKETISNSLVSFFDFDDGGLPEINIFGFQGDELARILEFLFNNSEGFFDDAALWVEEAKCDVSLSNFDNFRSLYEAWIKCPYHLLLKNLKIHEIQIPDLQFSPSIDQRELEISYQPGGEWTLQTVERLLEILKKIKSISPPVTVCIPEKGSNIFAGTDDGREFNQLIKVFWD